MSVREVAQFFVKPGEEENFIAGYREAITHLLSAEGSSDPQLKQGVETPNWFLFSVTWESVEAHLAFRESDALAKWRAPISPYFERPPHMEHFVVVA